MPVCAESQWWARFTVSRLLRSDGTGVVLAAFDGRLQRSVAVKICTGNSGSTLLQQARVLAKVAHPNVSPIYEVGRVANLWFVVTGLPPGRTLQALVGEECLSWAEVIDLFLAAGDGLVAMHAVGIAHGNFSVASVEVDAGGVPRIGSVIFGGGESDSPESTFDRDCRAFCSALWDALYVAEPEDSTAPKPRTRYRKVPMAIGVLLRQQLRFGGEGAGLERVLSVLRSARCPKRVEARRPRKLGFRTWMMTALLALLPAGEARMESCRDALERVLETTLSPSAEPVLERRGVALRADIGAACVDENDDTASRIALSCWHDRWVARDEAARLISQGVLLDARRTAFAEGIPSSASCRGAASMWRGAGPGMGAARRELTRAWFATLSGRRSTALRLLAPVRREVDAGEVPMLAAEAQALSGRILVALGRGRDAEPELLAAYFGGVTSKRPDVAAAAAADLAILFSRRLGHLEDASRWARHADLHAHEVRPFQPHTASARSQHAWGDALLLEGRYNSAASRFASAAETWARDYGRSHPGLSAALSGQAGARRAAGDLGAARTLAISALSAVRESATSEASVAEALRVMAGVLRDEGRLDRALSAVDRGIKTLASDQPAERTLLVRLLDLQGVLRLERGDAAASIESLDRALRVLERVAEPRAAVAARLGINRGITLRHLGELEASERAFAQAHGVVVEAAGPRHPLAALALAGLATVHRSMGRPEAAAADYQHARAILAAMHASEDRRVALLEANLALLESDLNRRIELLRRALDALHDQEGPPTAQAAALHYNLARDYERAGDHRGCAWHLSYASLLLWWTPGPQQAEGIVSRFVAGFVARRARSRLGAAGGGRKQARSFDRRQGR